MRKFKIIVGVISLLLLLQITLVLPVSGISQSTRDDTDPPKYPFVGYLGIDRQNGIGVGRMCSGTLIAPHAFLTAEMCIDPLYYNPGWQGYVTFDNPIKVGYPEDTGIAWISFQLDDIKFLWMYGMDDPSRRLDIVVIVLPENADIQVTPFSRLATAGLLDDLSAHGGLRDVKFSSVGYGFQADWKQGKPFGWLDDWRRYASAPFQALTPEWFDLNTNVYATCGGGACYFDAGGPAFLSVNGEDVLVGVAARIDRLCRANAGYVRLDTPWSQVLLRHFVPLP